MPPRPKPKNTPAKLASRMKRRWRIVLMRKTGEVLGTVEAADPQAAEKVAAIQFELDEFSAGGCWCRSWPGEREPKTVQVAADLVYGPVGDGPQGRCICFRN
jgi:hypothetical protein